MIERLCNSVYSTIDFFINDIDFCLSISFDIPVSNIPESINELISMVDENDKFDEDVNIILAFFSYFFQTNFIY